MPARKPADDDLVHDLVLTHDFLEDFALLDPFAHTFAYARFDSTSRTLCHKRKDMRQALESDVPGYHVGIPCHCCHADEHEYLLHRTKLPDCRVSFDAILANANFERFRLKYYSIRHHYTLVAAQNADVTFPRNARDTPDQYWRVLPELYESSKPIFVSIGPLGAALIHKYWERAPNRQTIIDVGYSLDPLIYGLKTKEYHDEDKPLSSRVCVWNTEAPTHW